MDDKGEILRSISSILNGVTSTQDSIEGNIRRIASLKSHEHFREVAVPALFYLAKQIDDEIFYL